MVLLNLKENLEFKKDKPAVLVVKKNNQCVIRAFGLLHDQLLPDYACPVTSQLILLEGELDYISEKRAFRLKEGDSFEVPVNVVHRFVCKSDKAMFLIFRENL